MGWHRLVLLTIIHLWLVSSAMLPIVDPGLFVIQGVQTCGLGKGYCLLSNSCRVDTDFADDADGGHCDGLSHAFNPKANFICCRFEAPSTTTPIPNTEFVEEEETLPPSHLAASSPSTVDTTTATVVITVETTTDSPMTTTTTEPSATTKRAVVSPFNIAANTNKILSSIQHLLSGGRMRPSVTINKFGPQVAGSDGGIYNDKSLLNLILLGLNETLRTSPVVTN